MELEQILPKDGRNRYLKIRKMIGEGFEIEYGGENHAPSVSFKQLLQISELFGTVNVDLDDYCNTSGCDTCGYGSDYGHTIQIREATLNLDLLNKLVEKGTIYG